MVGRRSLIHICSASALRAVVGVVLLSLAFVVGSGLFAGREASTASIMLNWIIQGTHAPYLHGKKIAGGPGVAVHDTISILLKAAHAENVKINWMSVQPQLFGPMLKRGEVDGTGGFTNSNIPAALEIGFKLDDLFVIKYSDFGADMYGLALVTTKRFADENPETVRGVVKAINQGTKDTIASPQKALELLKARDPMMKPDIEKVRLDIALGLTNTPNVSKNGLSSVTAEKLNRTIDAMVTAYQLPTRPDPAIVYMDRFLPPAAERMPPRSMN